jgi:hypothetical protein
MKKFILRKPKFMRSDVAMATYIKVAKTISDEICKSDSIDEKCELLKKMGECINKAAKAGGFFRTKDFIDYFMPN